MKLWGKFFLAVLTFSLLSYGISGAAYAAVEPLSVTTNKEFYAEGSTITISGFVKNFDASDPQKSMDVSIQIFAPNGNLATVAQVTPSSDGSFSTMINTASLKSDGTYMIKAQYVGAEIAVSVELTNAIEASETGTAVTGTAVTGTTVTGPSGESFYKLGAGQIEYDMTCNATPGFFANADDDSIVIYLNPTDDVIITVTLHEELIKPFEDGTFAVIVNNQEMQDFTQIGNTLTIPCMVGTEKIEIHGSWAIPEFGVIAAMILAVAIVSIIVVTAKTRLSLVPRY